MNVPVAAEKIIAVAAPRKPHDGCAAAGFGISLRLCPPLLQNKGIQS
jgi:hypothetical protein